MIKYLRKVGNSNAIVLDKALMELVGLEECGAVQVSVNQGSIVLTPTTPLHAPQAEFEAVLERVMKERKQLLRKLAQ